ncbi:MAG: PAS domain-containing protein [Flavipsychrobacter sp.]|nr:PAS domain-containing protein [Flavipsychrobacter sp.]
MIEDKYWGVVLNATPMPTILLKADHPAYTIVFANEAYLSFINMRREEIVGKSLTSLLHAHTRNVDEILQTLQQATHYKVPQRQPTVRYEFHQPQTGDVVIKYLDVITTPVVVADNKVEFIIRTINDVTDLIDTQQSEKAIFEDLVKHEKFLNESQRIARIGNWEVDLINNTIIWSDVLKEIYEVTSDFTPTYENSLTFLKDDRYRDILVNAVNEAIEKNNVFDVELQIVTAAGNVRWLRSTGKADLTNGIGTRLYGVTLDVTTSKAIEKALMESRNQYQALVESVEGVVWEADANTFGFTYISNKINSILGYTPEQWLNEPDFWANHIYEGDRDWAVTYCQNQTQEVQNHVFDYRMVKADGGIVWIKDLVSVITENGKPKLLRGVMVDVTESKLLASLDNLEKTVLELAADKYEELQRILTVYMKGIENLLPHMKCSMLQVKNGKVYTWAAPSLPKDYTDAINGQPTGEQAGSCGTSAYLKEKVIVADISTNPLWENYKQLALKYDLRACWSYPIINSSDEVMAVFGAYYDDIKEPGDTEQLVIERSAAILKVILENRQSDSKLQEIAWMQSHVVRAPLARLMGLVDILNQEYVNKGLKNELLDHIVNTAHELDKVVRDISDKTANRE